MWRRNICKGFCYVKAASQQFCTEAAGEPREAPRLGLAPRAKFEKSINQVTLLGRVGVNPQLRGTEEHPVTVFTIATHVNYKYQDGNMQQRTEWHRVSVFKPFLRDAVYKYLAKGQRVLIQGRLMYGQISDAGGVLHTTATVVADDVVFFSKLSTPEDDEEVL